jgi:hypothetical protein
MSHATAYTVSPALLAREDFRSACAARDFGTAFKLMRKYDGASQNRICSPVAGLSQSRVSKIMSGDEHIATLELIERLIDGLQIPGHYVGLMTRAWETLDQATSGGAVNPIVAAPEADTADVAGVFATRHSFATKVALTDLVVGATSIKVAGLSLNVICQQLSEQVLSDLVASGTTIRCLFLDPDGQATAIREMEEGHEPQHLSMLTKINMGALRRLRSKLLPEHQDRLQLAVYDETIRFNIFIIDDEIGVVQPYLPSARGLESPTLLLDSRKGGGSESLLSTFSRMFDQLWDRRKQ